MMKMNFPYQEVRAPQKEMMHDVGSCLEKGENLIIHAPTGTGKTIGVLHPAVRYASQNGKTVFFLTSRLSQHKLAVRTLQDMKKEGSFMAVDLVGKQHLCSFDMEGTDSSSFSTFCSAMIKDKKCKFYQNMKSPLMENKRERALRMLSKEMPLMSQDVKERVSSTYCSYEMLMELAKKTDVIVGDYFHVFSPTREKILARSGKKLENAVIIVDEAHGLADRLRDSMSAKISLFTLERAAKEARDFVAHDEAGFIEEMIILLEEFADEKLKEKEEAFVEKNEWTGEIERIGEYGRIAQSLAEIGAAVLQERKRSYIDSVASFLHAWPGSDYGFARILSKEIGKREHRKKVSIAYRAMDPSIISAEIFRKAHSAILMSATMSPMEMHRDILGLEPERTKMKSYSSPFPRENRMNIMVPHITTRYKERNHETYTKIASTVALCVNAVKGNTAVFFPSYAIRDKIELMAAMHIRKTILTEEQGMSKDGRDRIIQEMKQRTDRVLFGVLGGSFSEGVDLPGNALNGVIVVGLPLARPDLFTQSLIDYYSKRFTRGRLYAYDYPAIIKVMQAAGRCIRTEKDRGVCVFCDSRFVQQKYRWLFPPDMEAEVTERPELRIREFFGGLTG